VKPTVIAAEALCRALGEHALAAHCGAFQVDDIYVVFGNDGDRCRLAAELVIAVVSEHDPEHLAFSSVDNTWVILFTGTNLSVEELNPIVRDAWAAVGGGRSPVFGLFEAIQRMNAERAIRYAWDQILAATDSLGEPNE
jgi:hypothetical protein